MKLTRCQFLQNIKSKILAMSDDEWELYKCGFSITKTKEEQLAWLDEMIATFKFSLNMFQ
jgi:hypothetical protein